MWLVVVVGKPGNPRQEVVVGGEGNNSRHDSNTYHVQYTVPPRPATGVITVATLPRAAYHKI